jgi:hypothetical protein
MNNREDGHKEGLDLGQVFHAVGGKVPDPAAGLQHPEPSTTSLVGTIPSSSRTMRAVTVELS